MTKPEGMPQWAWDKAESALDTMLANHGHKGWRADSISTISKAILSAVEEDRAEKEAYREAIEKIAHVDEVELALDPVWAIRVAGAARREILAIRNRKES